ncbi:MAG: hypothetical protein WB760_32995 [Xanthobacteraceae bacterium]
MDTVRVDICYRPLRIAWAVQSGDRDAFRRAVRLNHTLWGGRFNPIVLVDRLDEAKQIVELFRADMVVAVGDAPEVKEFPQRFPHLIDPFFPPSLFVKDMSRRTRARVLDMHNAFYHWRNTPEWKAIDGMGVRRFVCEPDDPLADTFLLHYGAYPDAADIGIDYSELLLQATLAIDCTIDKTLPIPLDPLDHPSFGRLTREGLSRHYSVRAGWDHAGFFVGEAGNIDDLVCFWNLRAADIDLQFFDPAHVGRYALVKPEYERRTLARLAHLGDHRRNIAVWSRGDVQSAAQHFAGQPLSLCAVSGPTFWSGSTVRPPMMILGQASSLGVYGQEQGKPKVSFALNDKPFSADGWFSTQHLVASVTVLNTDEDHTFNPPYVPEWNEFFARTMHFEYNKLRIEPERIGIIIDAADHASFVNGLPVGALVEKLFNSIGMRAKLSGGGLIARQLIARLGGVDGSRVFKIPGVRRLLKTYGPRAPFTKKSALQLIGQRDPDNPQSRFDDHKQLYIESRDFGTDLTPLMVFEFLVSKGLFRIGAELTCSSCNIPSWIALDVLKHENVCELCGTQFDGTRQLVRSNFTYRRTGVLGLEKNTQGAIPVVLVMQQLHVNVASTFRDCIYAPSYDLFLSAEPNEAYCEVDLLVIQPRTYPDKAQVLLGECKDEGGRIDADDIAHLRFVSEALPKERFDPYILLAKLAPFSGDEIALARSLNGPYEHRVILLTARELEPYHLFERTNKELGLDLRGGSLEELAAITEQLYFK